MKRIYKYSLKGTDHQSIYLPVNSKVLSVAEQRGDIVIYALVDDTEERTEEYHIIIHGTGHVADDVEGFEFLGTVNLHDGRLMFHVFYKRLI